MFEFFKISACLLGGSVCLLLTFCIVAGIAKAINQQIAQGKKNK